MTLKIHRASDPIEVTQLRMLIYGQPGAWKSSVAFTAADPLMLDFDDGARRSSYRRDAVLIKSWDEVSSITADDVAPFKTVIIDTVGRALDFLSASLIAENPKNANRQGALTLQGYGALKSAFASWISRLNTLGLDVVMIAHDKESTNERDVKIVRPDITGGTYNEIFKLADAVGYLYLVGQKHILDFNPTENYVGKNPAQLDALEVPKNMPSNFLAEHIANIKTALGQISEEGWKIVKAVDDFRDKVQALAKPEELTAETLAVAKLDEPLRSQCGAVVKARGEELGFEFDRKAKAWKAKEQAAA
jgi:hypothetical protein